jgi:hypothetical protein
MKVKITPKQVALMALSERVAVANGEIEPEPWIAEEAEDRAANSGGWDASAEYTIGDRASLRALAKTIRRALVV